MGLSSEHTQMTLNILPMPETGGRKRARSYKEQDLYVTQLKLSCNLYFGHSVSFEKADTMAGLPFLSSAPAAVQPSHHGAVTALLEQHCWPASAHNTGSPLFF